MATDHILSLLKIERQKITAAIEALQGAPGPVRKAVPPPVEQVSKPKAPAKRKLSAAGRRAIIEGTKKRWAAINAAKAASAEPVPAPKAPPAPVAAKPKTSPAKNAAFRKKMSERMKAAWAARKKKAGAKSK
jgi:hypothetical protein